MDISNAKLVASQTNGLNSDGDRQCLVAHGPQLRTPCAM